MGHYLPSLYSEDLKNIIVAVDCSGSTRQEVPAFFAEIDQIVNDFQCTLTVISHDTRITAIEEFSSNDLPIRPRIQGGGGTDFRPVFEYIENSGADPAALIFLTDLYGPFPDRAPGYPVLWISTSDERAPFGDTVHMISE
jgi:predicted metal-dependent peptidase